MALLGVAAAGLASLPPADSATRARTDHRLRLTQESYAGVRCPAPNSIACDRISLAVWPAGHPKRLYARIAGRRITMQPPSESGGYWEGTLDHAGLLAPGQLHITPDYGRFYWAGRHPLDFTVMLLARYEGQVDAKARVMMSLHAGWG